MVGPAIKHKFDVNLRAVIVGIVVGIFTAVLTFALNVNNISEADLKKELNSKATIIYVDKAFEHHREVSSWENERIKNIEIQVNEIHILLMDK